MLPGQPGAERQESMSTTDPNAASFREQLDQRLQTFLDVLEPEEVRSFIQQAKADLGDGTAANDEEKMKKIEKFEGTLALYTLRAIDKLLERLQRELNTAVFTDPTTQRGRVPHD
jgi:hypothetical protein